MARKNAFGEIVITCRKCRKTSGDDWSQCNKRCPMPGSLHYSPEVAAIYATRRKNLVDTKTNFHNDT